MADVSVRPARPQDAERVALVQLSTWRTAYAHVLPSAALEVPEVQAAALWLGAIESPPTLQHRVLVAMERDELVGFAALGPGEDAVELLTLIVEPRWGRRGHGSRLLAASVEHWRGEDARTALCWVLSADDATRSFLTGAGWEPDGAARTLEPAEDGRADEDRARVPQVRLHTDLGRS